MGQYICLKSFYKSIEAFLAFFFKYFQFTKQTTDRKYELHVFVSDEWRRDIV